MGNHLANCGWISGIFHKKAVGLLDYRSNAIAGPTCAAEYSSPAGSALVRIIGVFMHVHPDIVLAFPPHFGDMDANFWTEFGHIKF